MFACVCVRVYVCLRVRACMHARVYGVLGMYLLVCACWVRSICIYTHINMHSVTEDKPYLRPDVCSFWREYMAVSSRAPLARGK